MDDRISALISALSDEETRTEELSTLTDEQLEATREELRSLFASIRSGEVEGVDPKDVETLTSIRAAIEVLDTEKATRVQAAAEADEAIATLEAGLDAGPEDDESDDGEGESEAPADEDTPAEAAVEEAATEDPDPEPEVVEAAAEPAPKPKRRQPSLATLASHVPEAGKPKPVVTKPRWQLLDGTKLTSELEIAERLIAAQQSLGDVPAGFPSQRISVVKLAMETDEAHTISDLEAQSVEAASKKIEAITAAAADPGSWTDEQRAIVASGGWCAPSEARYDIPSVVSAGRPFRDSLPRMNVRRGSVSFVRAARLSTILANTTGAAVTTWENTTDVTPGGSTKTRQTAACRTVQTETLGAVAARMRFGNFAARAFPEDIAHDIELLAARHARVAEVRLLDALIGDIDIDVTQAAVAGTGPDVKHFFTQAVSEMRYTERSDSLIRAAVSDVLIDMIYANAAWLPPGDDSLLADDGYARQVINSVRGLSVAAVKDVPTGTDFFATNSDGETLANWPTTFEIPFYFDGTAVFADGGSLDLGLVRDSTLNNTNDYEIFMETFEGLLWLGPYGKTLTLTTCPNGKTQVPTDVTGTLCNAS